MRQAARARADSATARTDTIIVSPADFVMTVGDSISMRGLVQAVAFDRERQPVPFFAPLFSLRPGDPVARIRNAHLVALATGTTVLFVGGSRLQPSLVGALARPSTQVRIDVRP
jgi:hypothetical protein